MCRVSRAPASHNMQQRELHHTAGLCDQPRIIGASRSCANSGNIDLTFATVVSRNRARALPILLGGGQRATTERAKSEFGSSGALTAILQH
jgi:hypothetical protein